MLKYEAIVIGASAGGLFALTAILSALSPNFPLPIIIVQHRSREEPTLLEEVISYKCELPIRQTNEKELIQPGVVYFAPPDYHLLIEHNRSFSLSFDLPVNYSRPAIDVLFESAAQVYKRKLLAIILTGANADGAEGIKVIRQLGGTTIAQDPATASFPIMPQAAVDTGYIEHIMNLDEIKNFLKNIKSRG